MFTISLVLCPLTYCLHVILWTEVAVKPRRPRHNNVDAAQSISRSRNRCTRLQRQLEHRSTTILPDRPEHIVQHVHCTDRITTQSSAQHCSARYLILKREYLSSGLSAPLPLATPDPLSSTNDKHLTTTTWAIRRTIPRIWIVYIFGLHLYWYINYLLVQKNVKGHGNC